MLILGARLTGFRNLADRDLAFSPGVNLFIGRNGQGKSNLLEALDYPALARSRRGARNEDLIAFERDHLHVALRLQTDDAQEQAIEYALDRAGGRRYKVDGATLSRRAELLGRLPAVFFQPDSIDLVRGEPELRRRFVDQALATLVDDYLGHLAAVQRAVRQKTSLLREMQKGTRDRRRGREEVQAWNRELACHAAPICVARRDYAAELSPYAGVVHAELADVSSSFQVTYRPSLRCAAGARGAEELAREILAEFDYIGDEEIRRGRPLSGPHRDDFEVRLAERDLKAFGSQGETRTAAVSLILAQSDVVYAQKERRPVLFLDDIFSELDPHRARRLQERCATHHQVFVATARESDIASWRPVASRVWHVAAGQLSEVA